MFLLLLFSITSAQAQVWPKCTDYLSCSHRLARENLIQISTLIEQESRKTTVDLCRVKKLQLDRDYTRWFLEHERDFQSLASLYLSLDEQAVSKIAKIRSNPVTNLPDRYHQSERSIGLNELVRYLSDLNAKLDHLPRSEISNFMRLREDADFNVPHFSHTQIMEALERYTQNLNSTLSETNVNWTLELWRKNQRYDLVLEAETTVGGVLIGRRFSFLHPRAAVNTPEFQQSLWDSISGSGLKIDGLPIEGHARYFEMYPTLASQCGNDPLLQYYRAGGVPFDKPSWIYKTASDHRAQGDSPYLAGRMIPVYETHWLESYYWSLKGGITRKLENSSYWYVNEPEPTPGGRTVSFSDTPSFYVFKRPIDGIPMLRLVVSEHAGGDELSTIDPDAEQFDDMNVLGYVFKDPLPRTVEMRKYGLDRKNEHDFRVMLDGASIWQTGWSDLGVLGYTFLKPPVYTHSEPYDRRYMYIP